MYRTPQLRSAWIRSLKKTKLVIACAREKGHHRNGLGPSVKLKCRCQKSLSKARQELNRISAALVVAVWWTGLKPCSIEDDRQGGAGGWTRPATRQAYGWSKLNANHRR